jgi:HPt (histidine-containing phosphotransfer) domain-containing protein
VSAPLDLNIDWAQFACTRADLGHGFVRILGYFREDGAKSVAMIEAAVKAGTAIPLVLPAHKLKSEAREFGALALAEAAEHIELVARDCVEWHSEPTAPVRSHDCGARRTVKSIAATSPGVPLCAGWLSPPDLSQRQHKQADTA